MSSTMDHSPVAPEAHAQLLVQLLLGSGLITRSELVDFKNIAQDLRLPLVQAIMSSGSLDKESLNRAGETLRRVQSKQISMDLAIRALRISVQQKISLEEAIQQAQKLHKTTRIVLSASNELTSLLLDAEIITREELGKLLVKSHETGMMIGQVIVYENLTSETELLAALHSVELIRAGALSRHDAVHAVRYTRENQITLEQALFETENFKPLDAKFMQLSELFLMSKLMSRKDYIECLEIKLFKGKSEDQILQERGLACAMVVECANQLLASVAQDILTPQEAAVCLNLVKQTETTMFAAVKEVRGLRSVANLRLGDLIVDAGIRSREEVEEAVANRPDNAVKVGRTILKQKLINETLLFAALRLQACLRTGYVSRDTAIALLRYCATRRVSLDQSFTENDVFVPSRIQWLWA